MMIEITHFLMIYIIFTHLTCSVYKFSHGFPNTYEAPILAFLKAKDDVERFCVLASAFKKLFVSPDLIFIFKTETALRILADFVYPNSVPVPRE